MKFRNDLPILRGNCEYIKSGGVQQETLDPSEVLTALYNAEFEMKFRIVVSQVMTSYSLVDGRHILERTF